MDQIAIISAADIQRHATRTLALEAIRQALIDITGQDSEIYPVSIGRGAEPDSMVAIKAGIMGDENLVGIKVGSYWPGNRDRGLPSHGSTTLLLDPETAKPVALLNVGALNGLRTAAANAATSDCLARADAENLLVLGAGHQARCEIAAVMDVRPIRRVAVWSRSRDSARQLTAELDDSVETAVVEDLEAAVRQADIIVTVTPAKAPLFPGSWVGPGTHISAMGADRLGKQELDPDLFLKARLFADHPAQSIEIGEFQHLPADAAADITAIGDVLKGSSEGRQKPEEITIFDSSGIALQDIAVARAVLQELQAVGGLTSVPF